MGSNDDGFLNLCSWSVKNELQGEQVGGPLLWTVAYGERAWLKNGQYFETEDCGNWALEDPTARGVRAKSITRNGSYLVGTDIVAGEWAADGEDALCVWSITKSPEQGSSFDDDRHFGAAFGQRVRLREGELFETRDCGNWALK